MLVAVRTLQEMSTSQAEMDFLMEALIMSKFKHPNIIHFIGVCFDKHPRYIVLELLTGGHLKNFSRESRPKPEKPSPLTRKGLEMIAIDERKRDELMAADAFPKMEPNDTDLIKHALTNHRDGMNSEQLYNRETDKIWQLHQKHIADEQIEYKTGIDCDSENDCQWT
ncbi:hypothetical protein JTB14_033850 [Gonioctena quinquepunctata]|nr:hypothetical protein JTB14_033850 [Gonioctena quinquepunctata]